MDFSYDLDRIISALAYNDLKGLLKIIDITIFEKGEPTLAEMEKLFKKTFLNLKDKTLYKQVENLMLSCARVNSIGY